MKHVVVSPLRYPGGKRRLARPIADLLDQHGLRPKLFVEPFAGGASVGLSLLAADKVERIGLADLDGLVASFWRTVFSADADWLIEQILAIPVTLATWRRLRADPGSSDRERALACLFLNRTSFSGVLNRRAGPIGGQTQTSAYPIDCRFPRETLARRIHGIALLRDRVAFVWKQPYGATVRSVLNGEGAGDGMTFYFDPPFFRNANRLYRHWFRERDHRRFRNFVLSLGQPWLLSYDWTPEFKLLYRDLAREERDVLRLPYSIATARIGHEVLLARLASADRTSSPTRPGDPRCSPRQETLPFAAIAP